MKGLLLDIYSVNNDDESFIKLCIKTEKGKEIIEDHNFKPYFYIISNIELKQKDLQQYCLTNLELAKKKPLQMHKFAHFKEKALSLDELEKVKVYKLSFAKISDLINARSKIINELFYLGKFEYDIQFDFRYIIDKNIHCLKYYEISNEKMEGFNFKELDKKEPELRKLAFDIETLGKSIDPKKEAIILLSVYSAEPEFKKVIGYKECIKDLDYYTQVKGEKELLLEFLNTIKKFDPDLIYSYNGDNFDFPFVKERCKKHDLLNEFNDLFNSPISRKSQEFDLQNYQHIDVYKIVKSLSMKGSLDLFKLDLDTVYNYLFGKHKADVKYSEMEKHYNTPELFPKFIEYNLIDSVACYEIGENFLEQFIALSQITGKTLQDVSRTSSSSIVEALIMHRATRENKIIPAIPVGATIDARENKRFQGAFVKEPTLGLHHNLAVVDFQSLYPSVIITYNISPETINEKTKNMFTDKEGNNFSQDIQATIPTMLKEVFDQRIAIKNKMKLAQKNSLEYKALFAYQWSFKTILNSTYGYMGYARARWYNFFCGQSIATTSREHTFKVLKAAEEKGLEVIYADTDSAFIKYKKDKKEILDFLDFINKDLPGVMQLSLDGLYKSGIFVQKKGSDEVAKKKYALLDENNNMKIVGFEYVRHDWSKLAKETQKTILDMILKDNAIEQAKDYIINILKQVNEHVLPNDLFTIYTQIRKDLENYSSIGPAVSAAKKAIARGEAINESYVGFIVTNNGKTISEKAELSDYVKQGDYDSEYYIENQIIPAVKNIFAIFNISEDQLMSKPSQKKLF